MGYFIFSIVKTSCYYYQTKFLERRILKTAFLPSAKLQEVLDRVILRSRKKIRFYESQEIELACAAFGLVKGWGVISKMVVEKLSRDELEAVVWHELCHIIKKDNFKKLLSFFSFQLLGFLPWNRFLFEQWEEMSEAACDQFAITRTSDPVNLASAIASVALFANSTNPLLVSGFSEKKSQVIRRVEEVLEKGGNLNSFRTTLPFFQILTLAAGTSFFLLLEFHLIPVLLCFLDACKIRL